MSAPTEDRKQITLSDVIQELSETQLRRVVAILRLTEPARRRAQPTARSA